MKKEKGSIVTSGKDMCHFVSKQVFLKTRLAEEGGKQSTSAFGILSIFRQVSPVDSGVVILTECYCGPDTVPNALIHTHHI